MIHFKLFLSWGQGGGKIFYLGVYLVSLLLQVALFLRVILYLFIVFTYLSYPFKVFVVILDDSNIGLFILIFELVLAFFRFFLFFLIFFFVLCSSLFILFLFFFEFSLLLHLAYSFSLPYLVISYDSLAHVVIIRIYELA